MTAFIAAAAIALTPIGQLTAGVPRLSQCRAEGKNRVTCAFKIRSRFPCHGRLAIRYIPRRDTYSVWLREIHC